jgi:TonB-dependent receptor
MLAGTPAAFAQTAGTAAGTAPADSQTVIVTGYRSSLQKALNIKRQANGVVDTIVAEDIAKFPDNNLAESIQRIPGVAISRDQGEGRALTVRGLGSDFTRVQINGMETQASTDGLATGTNRGRGFDFNVFASELFSRIDVSKTSSAVLPEGSLGATVDLYTARPFDYKGFKMAASAQTSYNDEAKKNGYRGAFLISNTFADGKLGVLFSAAYSKTYFDFQQANSGNWAPGWQDGGFCKPTTGTGGICDVSAADFPAALALYNTITSTTTPVFNPRFPRYVETFGDINRTGLTGSVQWRPSDTTELTLDMLYSKFGTNQDSYTMEPIGLSRGASQGGKPETVVRSATIDSGNTMVAAVMDNVDMRAEHNLDQFTTEFTQTTLNLKHDFDARLHFEGRIGYSKSQFDNFMDLATQIDRFNVDGYTYDMRPAGQDHPSINYGFDVTNPANWYFGPRVTQPGGTGSTGPEIRPRPNFTTNKYNMVRGVFSYDYSDKLKLYVGAEAKKYFFKAVQYRLTAGEADWPAYTGNMADITQQFCGLDRIAPPAGTPRCFTVPNVDAFIKQFAIFANSGKSALSTTNAAARGDNKAVTENDVSAFFMAQFNGHLFNMPMRGDAGVRFVRTRQQAQFYANVPTSVDPSGFLLTTTDRSYDDILPSANLVLEPSDTTVVRLSAAKVMSRPPLTSLAAATSVSVAGGSRTVTTGNSNLDPYRANTVDLSYEWYPSNGTIVSVGVFYKDISTYIQNLTTVAPYSTTGLPDSLLVGTGVAATDDFSITKIVNTPGGPLTGIELNYQQPFRFLPSPFDGLGALFNVTYVNSTIDYIIDINTGKRKKDDLLNLSRNSANATLYYEKGNWQARVSANYREGYLRSVPASFSMDVAGFTGATYYDASISYKVNSHVSITLEGLNLSDVPLNSWVDSATERVEDYRVQGRQYYLGVRYNF